MPPHQRTERYWIIFQAQLEFSVLQQPPSEGTISVCHAFLTILSLTGISVGALRTDIFHAYAAKKSADNTAWLESRKQTAITARRR